MPKNRGASHKRMKRGAADTQTSITIDDLSALKRFRSFRVELSVDVDYLRLMKEKQSEFVSIFRETPGIRTHNISITSANWPTLWIRPMVMAGSMRLNKFAHAALGTFVFSRQNSARRCPERIFAATQRSASGRVKPMFFPIWCRGNYAPKRDSGKLCMP
jgi:hypothetical protein